MTGPPPLLTPLLQQLPSCFPTALWQAFLLSCQERFSVRAHFDLLAFVIAAQMFCNDFAAVQQPYRHI